MFQYEREIVSAKMQNWVYHCPYFIISNPLVLKVFYTLAVFISGFQYIAEIFFIHLLWHLLDII